MKQAIGRRAFLRGAAMSGGGLVLASALPAWAQPVSRGIVRALPQVSGDEIALTVAHQMLEIDGRSFHSIGINGTVPAPLIRLKEGQRVRLTVDNRLDEDTSLHWHGLLVPAEMDGVPGVSFPGIKARGRFTYDFPVRQAGTYWYHSHSNLQEQMGLYGPLVIDPAGPDPVAYDREHVILLADHSQLHPHTIFRKLKQQPGYFNFQKQTLAGLMRGKDQPLRERVDWGGMRMDPADISDVTGSTYTYVVNGHGPEDNWTALFRPGERVRLRLINASAMTNFNVRIPGLQLTVVQADGLNVRPVTVDELQIAVAETYDVIVTPEDRAYSFVGEAVDRSGMARATLAPREGMVAEVPALRRRPLVSHKDMGMDHGAAPAAAAGAMDHSAHGGMDHLAHGGGGSSHAGMKPGGSMAMRDPANAPTVKMGPGVQMISPMPTDRTGEPGQGLQDVEHKVLVYKDLMALDRNPDVRAPSREMELHLTANMERYMWSFDGVKLNQVDAPLPFREGERVRVTLVNDTMMSHPIHLHGHYFELVTGHGEYAPRKHTVNVLPGGKVTFDVTMDARGDWAFHCHMLYHMHAGMMQVVTVRPDAAAA